MERLLSFTKKHTKKLLLQFNLNVNISLFDRYVYLLFSTKKPLKKVSLERVIHIQEFEKKEPDF